MFDEGPWDGLADLATNGDLWLSLFIGLVVAAATWAAATALGSRDPAPWSGTAALVSALIAVGTLGSLGTVLLGGLALVVVAEVVIRRRLLGEMAAAALVVAGACVAMAGVERTPPNRDGATAVVAVAALAIGREALRRAGFGPAADTWIVAGLAVGAFVTIPETELLVPLVGAVCPALLIAISPSGDRPTTGFAPPGALALATLIAALAIDGGHTRTSSIIGALAGFGWVFLLGAAALLVPSSADATSGRRSLRLVLGHAVVLLALTRVAGVLDSAPAALFTAAASMVLGVAAMTRWVPLARPTQPHDES